MPDIDDPGTLAGILAQLCEAASDYSRARRMGKAAAAENWRSVFSAALESRIPAARRGEVLGLFRESSCGGADEAHVAELAPESSLPQTAARDIEVGMGALEAMIGLQGPHRMGADPSAMEGESANAYFARTSGLSDAVRSVRIPARSALRIVRAGLLAGLRAPGADPGGPGSRRVPHGPFAGLTGREAYFMMVREHASAMGGPASVRSVLLAGWVAAVDSLSMEVSP